MATTDPETTNLACLCPTRGILDLLARRHAIPIVCAVGLHEPIRFGELESHYPDASTSTLSTRLDELAEAGLIDRTQYDEIPRASSTHSPRTAPSCSLPSDPCWSGSTLGTDDGSICPRSRPRRPARNVHAVG